MKRYNSNNDEKYSTLFFKTILLFLALIVLISFTYSFLLF